MPTNNNKLRGFADYLLGKGFNVAWDGSTTAGEEWAKRETASQNP